jgi:RNA polymerase sigma factor (sigma-70 family)
MDGTLSGSSPRGRQADAVVNALERAGGEKLRAVIRRIVGSTQVTEDVLQQACERFLRHSGDDLRSPGAWLRRVATNLAISHVRKNKRDAEVVFPDDAPELATACSSVERAAEWRDFDERFTAALGTLSAEQMKLIDLHYWREMTVKDIASLWGISVEAVQQRLTRALHRCRAAMIHGGIDRADLE